MTSFPIYLDNHSTTPMDPRVFEVMRPYFLEDFGNPSSKDHAFGWKAAESVSHARLKLARSLGAHESEIYFSSGATESNNTAIKGAAHLFKVKGNHIITSVIEHKSVLDACAHLAKQGFEISYIKVNSDGLVDLKDIERAITPSTILLSFMLANNEIGTVNPVKEIGLLAKKNGIIFHCDAVQGFGRLPLSVNDFHVDLLSLSGHKIYGPKGVGALFMKRSAGICIEPLIHGGGQENGMRSGTLNVPGIVGFAEASALIVDELESESIRIASLRDLLLHELQKGIPQLLVNGSLMHRVPGNLNLSFLDIDPEHLMLSLCQEVALSAGSACSSSCQKPSHVLAALNQPVNKVHSNLRFGIGRFNSEKEIMHTARLVIESVNRLDRDRKKVLFHR